MKSFVDIGLTFSDAVFLLHVLDSVASESIDNMAVVKDAGQEHVDVWKNRAETCRRIHEILDASFEEAIHA